MTFWQWLYALPADMVLAAIPAVGFAMVFNVPVRALKYCALAGALGHGCRFVLMHQGMPIEWASFFAALRMFRTFFVNSSWSAWEQLRRKTLTPASISSVMVFSLDDAGPRVATTLVLLGNFILTGLALVGRREARGGP